MLIRRADIQQISPVNWDEDPSKLTYELLDSRIKQELSTLLSVVMASVTVAPKNEYPSSH